jgi:hypothetical protein
MQNRNQIAGGRVFTIARGTHGRSEFGKPVPKNGFRPE